jgi:hypothetical protein
MYIPEEERFRPFVVTALIGGALWAITGGFIHAFLVSIDWDRLSQNAVGDVFSVQPVIALIVFGLVYGLCIEVAKFLGAVFRSQGLVLLLPLIAGAILGSFQGTLVAEDVWGFTSHGIPFRSADTRAMSGAVFGFILAYPAILAGIGYRSRFGSPW